MKIQEPTVGPILGYTTATEARIFVRGDVTLVDGAPRRCFGVVQWRRKGAKKWSKPLLNKMEPHFDGTCVFALDGLQEGTPHEYRAGWFYADAGLDKLATLDDSQLEWPDGLERTFLTGTDDARAPRTLAAGSCRYLLRLLGGAIFDRRGDKVFESILRAHTPATPVHALLMVGDQIYADDLNFIAPDTRIDQFLSRYRMAFSQDGIRAAMAQVPTYMILDDHEIEDNWPEKATQQDRLVLYPHAVHAYQIYQCSHSPVFTSDGKGRIEGTPNRFWYQFRDGCADVFVMDSRTERVVTENERRMIGKEQMDALLTWLKTPNDGRVRFVVTSVPVFPDFESDRIDKWQGFAQQRASILDFITANRIDKVVFVSGDVHCSYVGRLDGPNGVAVHSIVSSSFFWPYPHTAQADFDFGKALEGAAAYTPSLLSELVREDNYAMVSARPDGVAVSFLDRKGSPLGGGAIQF